MMQSSMSAVLTAPQPVLIMYTSFSRTDSEIRTFVSPIPLRVTSALERGTPMLGAAMNSCGESIRIRATVGQ
jgi:hypothetical protein